MGGLGKTTLAQYVCKHVKDKKCFEPVMWVHVSENFDIRSIMKKMWESVQPDTERSCPEYENLDVLISHIRKKLKDKKYLLVLDDVWCNKGVSQQELNQLFAPLNCGSRGSKILVTTRNEDAARTLGARDLIKLRELDDNEFLSLFMTHAFPDGEVDETLRKIGVEIARKLCRSPLAEITVAGQLRTKPDPKFWMTMSNKRLLNDVMGSLYLSYQNLHPTLQRCFAFCSLFPKWLTFRQNDLVNLWIAEGFIETEDNNEHVKDIADQYFLELVSGSFFQVNKENSYRWYSMHDLIRDLAQHVSKGECFRIEIKIESGENNEIPTHTRHLYVDEFKIGDYMEKICKIKDLRTIICHSSRFSELDLDALFINLRKLRVVQLGFIRSLPKSVIHLKNLRYLNIEIPDVGRLILLQDLREFQVRKKRGFELKQLEHLTDMSGSLSIYGLHKVERKEEARKVKLSEKKGLRELRFNWNGSKDVLRDNDVEILDGLCPPPQIKELDIEGYRSKRFPNWILENNDNISHLESLRLTDCIFLEALSGVDKLSNLLSLTISDLFWLKSWVPPPINLTLLDISGFFFLVFALKDDLETIKFVASLNNQERNYFCPIYGCQFERVQEIIKQLDGDKDEQALSTIANDLKGYLDKTAVDEFKGIYGDLYLPPALEYLSIKSCIITDRVLAGSLQGLTSLTQLTLKNILTITCITDEVLCSLTSLGNLEIRACLLLTSLGGWDIHGTLEILDIYDCPNLTLEASLVANSCNTMEQASSSCKRKTASCILKTVSLEGCSPLDDCFQNLVSIEMLTVRGCSTIVNPHIGNLRSLIKLEFNNCSNLISLSRLSELNHLEELDISGCQKVNSNSDVDKLPRLRKLLISKLSLVEQVIIRDGLSSLVSLELFGAEEEYFSQQECEVLCCLSSLEKIKFDFCEVRMLPSLLGLRTLRSVEICGCSSLTSLSEVPPSVREISIKYCNEDFTKSCRDPENPNWQKISHVPEKDI